MPRISQIFVRIVVIATCALAVTCSSKKSALGPDSGSGSSGVGPACTSDGTCAQPTPYCDTSAGHCVQCLGNPNCGNGRHCSATHECVQCTMDTQCGGMTPYCSPGGGCVECLDMGNCGSGTTCDTNDYRCVATCTTSTQCHAPTGVCNTTTSYCVQCLQSSDCTTLLGRVCDTTNDTCVECLADTDCTTAPRTKCDTADHACVQCLSASDCAMGQTCTPEGVCR